MRRAQCKRRISKNGAQTSASGALFPTSSWSIPMIGADFLHGSPKSVEVGPKLPLTEEGTGDPGKEKAPWQGRKMDYLDHISEMSTHALLISVCDKLQSARELKRQVRRQGDGAYRGFVKEVPESGRKDLVLWFHLDLVLSYRTRIRQINESLQGPINEEINALIEDFAEIVEWLDAHP